MKSCRRRLVPGLEAGPRQAALQLFLLAAIRGIVRPYSAVGVEAAECECRLRANAHVSAPCVAHPRCLVEAPALASEVEGADHVEEIIGEPGRPGSLPLGQ